MKQKYAILLAAVLAMPTMFSVSYAAAETLSAPVSINGVSGNVMTVTPDGKVGIGTTAPKTPLHVAEGNATTLPRGIISAQHNDGAHGAIVTFLKSRGTADDPKPLGYDSTTGLWDYVGAVVAQPWSSAKGIYDRSSQIGFRLDSTPKFAGGNPTAITFVVGESLETLVEAMRITSSGKVGIGTAAPETQLQVVKDTTAGGSVVFLDGYEGTGDTNNGPNIAVRQARGTVTDPLPTRAGDIVGQVNFRGRGPSGFASIRRAGVLGYATESYTDTAQGTMLTLATTANGSTNPVDQVFVTGMGNVGVGINSPSQKLEVDGGLKLNSNSARPPCTSDSRGTFWVTKGATSDHVSVCLLKHSGAYKWVTLVSGADDEHEAGNTKHKESD